MSAHSPGPWIAERQAGSEWWFGGAGGGQIVIRRAGGEAYESLAVLGAAEPADPLAEADARLMAASPNLLRLLEALLGCGASFYPTAIEGGTPVALDFTAWEKEARAAIAEAAGGAS